MFNFLRKIRMSLIESLPRLPAGVAGGSTRKYIFYAIGEILLVMIGILLALQVNNWNEWRKDRVKEKKVLVEVASTLERNCHLLTDYIEDIAKYNSSTDTILLALENRLPYSDTYSYHFHTARVDLPINFVSNAGYEELKNAGFDILLNDSLKNEIVNIFETTYPRMREILDSYKTTNQDFLEHIRHHFYDISFKQQLIPVDYEQVLDDHYFYSALMNTKGLRNWYSYQQNICLKESQRVLQLIKDELEEV